MALARARQLRGYRSHLDSQTKKREAIKNKSKEDKKKLRFDLNNNERKEERLTLMSRSVQASLSFSMKLISHFSYINKNKNYINKKKKT